MKKESKERFARRDAFREEVKAILPTNPSALTLARLRACNPYIFDEIVYNYKPQ